MLKPILENKTECDYRLDYIPFASTFTNLYYLFQKCTYPTPPLETVDHHYEHLQSKSFTRCIILLVPILGNIAIGIGDFLSDIKLMQLQLIKAGLISLSDVSLRLQKDDDILKSAIENNSENLRYVRDPEIAVKLFNAERESYLTIDKLHDSLKSNYDVLKAAVLRYPRNLVYINNATLVGKLWTDDVISPNLNNVELTLCHNKDLQKIALAKDPKTNLPFITNTETLRLFFKNRKETDCLLSYIHPMTPKNAKETIADAAIAQNPKELSCLTDPLLVAKLFDIKGGPATLQYLHPSLINNIEVLDAAVYRKPKELLFVTDPSLVCQLFQIKSGRATLEHLPPSLENTKEILEAATTKDPKEIRFIKNKEFVLLLLKKPEFQDITLSDIHSSLQEDANIQAMFVFSGVATEKITT